MATERVRSLSRAIAINLLISTIEALIKVILEYLIKAISKKRNRKND